MTTALPAASKPTMIACRNRTMSASWKQVFPALGKAGNTPPANVRDYNAALRRNAMKRNRQRSMNLLVCVLLLISAWASGQVTQTDYDRASKLRERFQGLAINVPERAYAIADTSRFWYRKSVKGGNEFVVVDPETMTKKPAFDHTALAASLSSAAGRTYTALTLPFSTFTFVQKETAIEFTAAGTSWKCELVAGYPCSKVTNPRPGAGQPEPPEAQTEDSPEDSPREYDNDVFDGMVDLSPQSLQPPQGLQAPGQDRPRGNQEPRVSPDGAWEALVLNYNVFIRPKGKTSAADSKALSFDGSEGNYYSLASIAWSPDSKWLVAYRVRPGYRRQVHYVESSPADQIQPKHWVRDYAKPGDALDVAQPVLFEAATGKQLAVDNTLFPNPYSLSNPVFRKDSRAFTFEYNQRGHQLYRVIEVETATGKARSVISEESKTFINYRPLV